MQPRASDSDKRRAALSLVTEAYVEAAAAVCRTLESASPDVDEPTLKSFAAFDDARSRYKRAVKEYWSAPHNKRTRQFQAETMPADALRRIMRIEALRWFSTHWEADKANVRLFRLVSEHLTGLLTSAQRFGDNDGARRVYLSLANGAEDMARSWAAEVREQV